MEKLIMKRGTGKTYQLIKMSAETGNCIVCQNYNAKGDIIRSAEELGVKIPSPISYSEFIDKKYGHNNNINGFLIDDADMLLEKLTNVKINAITISP